MDHAVEATGAYKFGDVGSPGHHAYNLPAIESLLPSRSGAVLDAGCGAGQVTSWLHGLGFEAWGTDPSESGIELASQNFKGPNYFVSDLIAGPPEQGPADGFDGIVSVEVVEHLFDPEAMLENCHKALKPGGWIILTTPYHGYVKNLVLALTNKYDSHWMVDMPGGHIKFFSPKTITDMLHRAGFTDVTWKGAGRGPMMWCSMVVRARKA
jgi:2-polyprenyl-3-methyl-5-hydroxy-6-metoxy-1,4-benzoquinol methylase